MLQFDFQSKPRDTYDIRIGVQRMWNRTRKRVNIIIRRSGYKKSIVKKRNLNQNVYLFTYAYINIHTYIHNRPKIQNYFPIYKIQNQFFNRVIEILLYNSIQF